MLITAPTSASSPPVPSAQTPDLSSPQLRGGCALLALMVQGQCTSQSASKTDVQLDWKKMQELKQELADAIKKAQDAASNSGFWGFLGDVLGSDIAEIAGAVAAAAAVVATGGAAAPLLLVTLSTALQAGAKVGAELGLDPKICAAISLASAAVGLFSGAGTAQAVGTVANTARAVEVGASVAQGGATVAGGAAHYVSGHYQAKQQNDQADAVGHQAQDDTTSLDLDSAMALLERSLRTEQRETSTVAAITKNDSDTNNTLCNRI